MDLFWTSFNSPVAPPDYFSVELQQTGTKGVYSSNNTKGILHAASKTSYPNRLNIPDLARVSTHDHIEFSGYKQTL